ncbi:MAG: MBL fold metallo-hydrolase [Lachnospiraceae bacterium]|nr:MBL fold metallo-hydrolase [Lachnospiraceae bacterium]
MITLRYGNTNTFFLRGNGANLLVDTDYAGTLSVFYKEIKNHQIGIRDITYVLATHYHPDHIGIISELMEQGVKLLLIDTQIKYVHFADEIFRRDNRLKYKPISETKATVISCSESRDFLLAMGISGEVISTTSHSEDSISVILDSGDCIVGDLEPIDYLAAYNDNPKLKNDWDNIMRYNPKRILYAHANEKIIV